MDTEYHLDYDAILKTVREADVIAFRFVTVPMRLLIDNRFTEADPPMVKLVPPAGSAEERFKSLKMLRPRFRLPQKISAIWWPRYINGLVETGVWDAIVAAHRRQRLRRDAPTECDDAARASCAAWSGSRWSTPSAARAIARSGPPRRS